MTWRDHLAPLAPRSRGASQSFGNRTRRELADGCAVAVLSALRAPPRLGDSIEQLPLPDHGPMQLQWPLLWYWQLRCLTARRDVELGVRAGIASDGPARRSAVRMQDRRRRDEEEPHAEDEDEGITDAGVHVEREDRDREGCERDHRCDARPMRSPDETLPSWGFQ